MEQIAENTADSLTESVKEVNQFTQYFQGKQCKSGFIFFYALLHHILFLISIL